MASGIHIHTHTHIHTPHKHTHTLSYFDSPPSSGPSQAYPHHTQHSSAAACSRCGSHLLAHTRALCSPLLTCIYISNSHAAAGAPKPKGAPCRRARQRRSSLLTRTNTNPHLRPRDTRQVMRSAPAPSKSSISKPSRAASADEPSAAAATAVPAAAAVAAVACEAC